jgi:hypothetical protein
MLTKRLRSQFMREFGLSALGNEAADEIEWLRAALQRIDGINDNPACYNVDINAVLDRILRPGLEQKAAD